ncbi:uncharacterized protein V6R79_024138 [Siganus canaliculatus]
MEATSPLWLLCGTLLLSCRTGQGLDPGPPASVKVSPSSSQVFSWSSISLSCEGGQDPDGWSLRRNTTRENRTPCGYWGSSSGSTCTVDFIDPWDSGVYWCESSQGGTSGTISITVSGGPVILQSPVLPVVQGHSVTLTCRTETSSTLPADFYKDGARIGAGPEGHMTLLHVSKADEGNYSCSIRDQGQSPSSWMSVTEKRTTTNKPSTTSAPPTSEAPPSSEAPPTASILVQLWFRLLCHLVVFCPYCISTVLMVPLYRQRSTGTVSMVMAPPTQAEQGLDEDCDDVTTEHHF